MPHLELRSPSSGQSASLRHDVASTSKDRRPKAPMTELAIQHAWLVAIEPEAFYANVPCTD